MISAQKLNCVVCMYTAVTNSAGKARKNSSCCDYNARFRRLEVYLNRRTTLLNNNVDSGTLEHDINLLRIMYGKHRDVASHKLLGVGMRNNYLLKKWDRYQFQLKLLHTFRHFGVTGAGAGINIQQFHLMFAHET